MTGKKGSFKQPSRRPGGGDVKENTRSLGNLNEALDLIPNEQKAAYLEAKERCPWLVENEPGLMKFLHYERFDFWAAARRLVVYWEARKEVFGPDLAFKPMHQTGNGALTTAELEVLSSGFISVLPKDERDRSVLCFIPSRLVSDRIAENLASRRRCTFYVYSVILEISPVAQAEFSSIMMTDKVGFQRSMAIGPMIEVLRKLPMYSDVSLIAHCPDDVDNKLFLGTLMPRLLQVFRLCSPQINAISASSKQDVTGQVLEYGFKVESLPPEFGGTWTLEDFGRWQRDRIQLERRRESCYDSVAAAQRLVAAKPSSVVPVPVSTRVVQERVAGQHSLKATSVRGNEPAASASAAAKSPPSISKPKRAPPRQVKGSGKETKRIPDKVHSQRKRVRRKAKFNALQSAYSDTLLENKRLKAESRRLEKLVNRAQETVRSHTAPTSSAVPAEAAMLAPQQEQQVSNVCAGAAMQQQQQRVGSSLHVPTLSANQQPQQQQQVWYDTLAANISTIASRAATINSPRLSPPSSSCRGGGNLNDLVLDKQPPSLPLTPFFAGGAAASSMQPSLTNLAATNSNIQWDLLATAAAAQSTPSVVAPSLLTSTCFPGRNNNVLGMDHQGEFMNNAMRAFPSFLEQQSNHDPTEQVCRREQQQLQGQQRVPPTNHSFTSTFNSSTQSIGSTHNDKLRSGNEWKLPLNNQTQSYCEMISKRNR